MRRISIVLLLAAACARGPVMVDVRFETADGPVVIRAEIADNLEERVRGLRFRESLAEGTGMLFVWPDVGARDFVMEETLIPLDLISIRAGRVVGVQRMVPCDDPSSCDGTAATTPPADAALEVNAGTAERAGIVPGALVEAEPLA